MILEKIKMYAIMAAVLGFLFLASNAFTAWKFFGYGKANELAKWQGAQAKAVNDKIGIKGRIDEVQNAPLDADITIRRMFNSSY